MATLTGYLCVPAGQTESGLVMSEAGSRFPALCAMALLAFRGELPSVYV
ncbi:MAG: hypothetical protein WBG01_04675 [Bacteroidota bacterium]